MTVQSIHFAATSRAPVDLGNGLIMRWSSRADTANVSALVGASFRWMTFHNPPADGVIPGPNEFFAAGARRLLTGKNATMSEHDYALIEDTKREEGKNPIVACVSLHRLRAFYGSVDLFFGKPELVATDPEYRNQGFVRKLLKEMIHPESDARGDVLQLIPGIPHFYRQFGYEYALCSFNSGKIEDVEKLPKLGKDQKMEPYRLRKATEDDIPYLVSMSTKDRVDPCAEVGLYYGQEYWQWTVHDIYQVPLNKKIDRNRDSQIVVDAATGEDVGFTVTSQAFGLKIEVFVVDSSKAFISEALYPILRGLAANEKKRLEALKAAETDAEEAEKIKTEGFSMLVGLPQAHPVCQLLGPTMTPPGKLPGFRFFTRIADYAKFIKAVQPELEKRLANSPMAGTTGRVQLDFYRIVEGNNAKGLEIVLEKGKMVEIHHWAKPSYEQNVEQFLKDQKEGKPKPRTFRAAFAPLTFTALVTGERSFEELQFSYGENTCESDDARLLLNILFPKVTQHVDTFYW
ncbi:hypothetical protein EMPS_01311 [Entomortierella parvispora]|uniref:N-acetyltransferase domain-containing protein n=1 Tax=Entomortierella parvispora TaxID=205924 RepID=A0A9P3LSU5_9FUNG|nr:hypothetical protein EMPS_01311 [Entomortierella parvispora]